MMKPIRILNLEDDALDTELIHYTLESAEMTCQITRVENGVDYDKALREEKFDVILADYKLPGYDGMTALKLALELCPDTPFIFVSGVMGEDAVINGLTQGATDYVLKLKLSRLAPAVKRALSEAENLRERKRAEEALQESMEHFRSVADSAVEGIISADRQGLIIYWNKAAKGIFGYSEKEILGQSIAILMPDAYQDQFFCGMGLSKVNTPSRQIARTLEIIGRRKNGDEFPAEISVASWKTHEGVFYTAMVRDITARKQAEENLRLQSAALEAAANAIVITNQDGIITWVNPAFTQLTGYKAEEAIGQNPRILKSGRQDLAFYTELWDTILSGKIWHGELVNCRADGSKYSEEMTIAPVCQKEGTISHFVAIKQDISDRKQHELEREAIVSVANAMRTATTRVELLEIFLSQIIELFDGDGSMLTTPDAVSGGTIIEMGCGLVGARFMGLQIPPGRGASSLVIAEGRTYLNNNAHIDSIFFRPDLLGESHAVACVPLIAQEKVIGALWLARKQPITESDVKLLVVIANLAANAIHRVTLHEQTEQQLRYMASLHQIDITISSAFDLKVIFNVLLKNAVTQLGVDAASILLLKPDIRLLEYAAGFGFATNQIEKSLVGLGEGRAGMAAYERRTISFPYLCEAQDTFSRAQLLSEEKFVSHHVTPLIVKGEVKGVLEVFCRRHVPPTTEWVNFFESLATQAAIAIDNTTLFNKLQQSNVELTIAYDATIEGWSRALDMRDRETEGHTQRVAKMAIHLAKEMGMSGIDLVNVQRGALLHDIGKMGVPDSILLKPDKLTAAEWDIMRQHSTNAYEMLSPISYLRGALDIPYCHHEKWDGSGYPRRLKGNYIPLAARIFAIVDVWDALTSDRPYRAAWPKEKALAYIREQSGIHFDPKIVTAFLNYIRMLNDNDENVDDCLNGGNFYQKLV